MKKLVFICFVFCLNLNICFGQDIQKLWTNPPAESKSWTFWYWMQGAVTKEGITADLEAMSQIGLEGAYLMPIKGIPEKPFVTPIVEQLSPLWWEMVDFAFKEADRVGIKIGFHICDGFALAGGPWITPEMSMQKVVWSTTSIKGGKTIKKTLPQPESYKGYYKDIALFAYPTPSGEDISTETVKPKVTNSLNIESQFLADKDNGENFRSESPCWIQYEFDTPFTCRTIQITPAGNNFQSQRFTISSSDDGISFREIIQLQPPRQGWQNTDFEMTHSIPPTTAKYFRFSYDKSGTEPGAEDLDAAKWKQSLKIKSIYLSSEARIHQYEGKNGSVWRVSPRSTQEQLPNDLCIRQKDMIDITQYLDSDGKLTWKAPKGNWTILRMGHTSTGHTNATGGKGSGLECDKFNPDAIRLQFNSWFGKAIEVAGTELASRVLKVFHVDSWECGSQNWSSNFREEFKQRRGYDIYNFLPVMAGIPIESAEQSERVLYDVRQTISELVTDKFYSVLKTEANAKGCQFSAECVSPTMLSDGMLHYKNTDLPMGEYWLQSPTHDKPNDVLDAVSGAHIYEKNIVQAESFTQLRTVFNEHPAMLKTLQDRHYALGINRLSYHVNVLNPWLDRKPGMTLDGIGLLFQRDQTWWKLGKAWLDYAQRCQSLLQYGKPVVDIAVFTGEELPRRAILPDRLVPFLPGIFGSEKVEKEKIRLANIGEPTHQMPVGVTHSANITDSEDWINSLRGYQYDSFNPDALLNLAKVKNGRIVLPGGMSYGALVVPGKHPMQPDADRMSPQVAAKLLELVRQGATILVSEVPEKTMGLMQNDKELTSIVGSKANFGDQKSFNIGKGQLIRLPYTEETFSSIGIDRDFIATEGNNTLAEDIAYTHRADKDIDIYFISNQQDRPRTLNVSLRVANKAPELWNPVTSSITPATSWIHKGDRTELTIDLDANESVFIVLQETGREPINVSKQRITEQTITTPWAVQFDSQMRGPKETVTFAKLSDWSENDDELIRYYSGTAVYNNTFGIKKETGKHYFIELNDIFNMAEVKINGIVCDTIWTKPYRLDITNAVTDGINKLEISVVNTWANRIMGDEDFGAEKDDSKRTWTNARYRMADKKLVKSGLVGEVKIKTISK